MTPTMPPGRPAADADILDQVPGFDASRLSAKGRHYASMALALVFAACLAVLPVDAFMDRAAYLVYPEGALAILALHTTGGLGTVLTNEPAWLLLNAVLALFFDAENCVRIIIAGSAYLVARTTFENRFDRLLLVLLFLLLPQVLKNYVIHLRQGVAIALFMAGWFGVGGRKRWGLIALTPFIHASFFFVLAFMLFNRVLAGIRGSAGIRMIAFLAVGLFLSFATIWLAATFGARQAGEYEAAAGGDASGLGFVFWTLFGCIYVLQGSRFLREHMLQIGVLIFYLCSYFFLPVSARIFESVLLLILLAGLELTRYRKLAFLILFSFYFFAQWYPRLGQAALGWGADA